MSLYNPTATFPYTLIFGVCLIGYFVLYSHHPACSLQLSINLPYLCTFCSFIWNPIFSLLSEEYRAISYRKSVCVHCLVSWTWRWVACWFLTIVTWGLESTGYRICSVHNPPGLHVVFPVVSSKITRHFIGQLRKYGDLSSFYLSCLLIYPTSWV